MKNAEQVSTPFRESVLGGSEAQLGASAHFVAFYDRHVAAVYGVAVCVLGDGPRAEAVAEEVFARAWQAGVERRWDWDAPRDQQYPADTRGPHLANIWLLRLTHVLAQEAHALMTKAHGATRDTQNDLPIAAAPDFLGEALTLNQRDMLTAIFWRGVTLADLAKKRGTSLHALAKELQIAMAQLRTFLVADQGTVTRP